MKTKETKSHICFKFLFIYPNKIGYFKFFFVVILNLRTLNLSKMYIMVHYETSIFEYLRFCLSVNSIGLILINDYILIESAANTNVLICLVFCLFVMRKAYECDFCKKKFLKLF